MRPPLVRLITAITLAGALAACASGSTVPQGANPGQTSGQLGGPKRLTMAVMSNPTSLSAKDVAAGNGTFPGGDDLEDLVNGGLTVPDNKGTQHPQLAEAVPSLDNGLWQLLPDGRMTTSWTIRPDAEWHDGTPFTVDDLRLTMQLGQDRELSIFYDPTFDLIETIEEPTPGNVVVTWKGPFIQADAMFSLHLCDPRPYHVLEPLYQENKDALTTSPYWTQGYVGVGPFKVRQWVAGSYVLLDANEHFPLGRPKIDQIEIRFIPSPDTLAANILAGEVQLAVGRNLSLQQALQVRDQWTNGHVAIGLTNWIGIYPQLTNPTMPALLSNVDFRRALLLALDRQQLVETLQAGLVPVADVFISPSDPAYEPVQSQIVRYPYEPARAAQILGDLGYAKSADGVFHDGAGQTLGVQVQTAADDDAQVAATLATADAWKHFGLAAEPYMIPQEQRNDRQIVATYPGVRVWRLPNDVEDLRRYTSAQAPVPENRFVGGNRSRYMDPGFDALIGRYMTTIPREARYSILGEIVQQMTDQVVIMGLWYNTNPVEMSNRLLNVTPRDVGATSEAWNAQEWDLS